MTDGQAETWSQHDKQMAEHLDSLWKLATQGGCNNKIREGIKDHLRRIAILRKAQKAALAELFNEC